MAKLTFMQEEILKAIESEMNLIHYLDSKYMIGTKLAEREDLLSLYKIEVLHNKFLLERETVSNNCQVWHVYFKDASCFTCRVKIHDAIRLIV